MKFTMSIEDYHKDKSAISSSTFRNLDKCPAYYLAYRNAKPNNDADYFRIGQAFHTKVLEPEKFDSEFLVIPNFDARTKEGKALKEKFELESQGKIILKTTEYDQVSYMGDSILKHSEASALLIAEREVEVSMFWFQKVAEASPDIIGCPFCWNSQILSSEDKAQAQTVCPNCGETILTNSVWVKTRPDFINPSYIIDIKSTKNVNPDSFSSSVNSLHYDGQAAFQLAGALNEGYDIKDYYWIVVEKEFPYLTAVYKASQNTLQNGRDKYFKYLNVYKNALDNNNWSGYPNIMEI